MEETLLENLRRNQAFDAALKKGTSVDRLVAASILAILTQSDPDARATMIRDLESSLVQAFKAQYQPAATSIAQGNAARVLKLLPPPTASELASARQAAVNALTRTETRVQIVRANINDAGNTLENKLNARYLEPGAKPSEVRSELVQEYRQQEQKRLEFDKASEQFNKGVTEVRPRKPQLDFGSRFTEDAKQSIREQARRTGTDAETAEFAKKGYTILFWCAVSASQACPDCKLRNGVKGDMEFWDRVGRPGSGRTICRQSCFCLLLPIEGLHVSPGLKTGLSLPRKGVLTTTSELGALNENR